MSNITDRINSYLNKKDLINEVDDSNEVEQGYRARRAKYHWLYWNQMMEAIRLKKDFEKEARDKKALYDYIHNED